MNEYPYFYNRWSGSVIVANTKTRYYVLEVSSGAEGLRLGKMLNSMRDKKDIDTLLDRYDGAFWDLCLTGKSDALRFKDKDPKHEILPYSEKETALHGFTHYQFTPDIDDWDDDERNIPYCTWQGVQNRHSTSNEYNYLFDGEKWLYLLDAHSAVEVEDVESMPLEDFVAVSHLEKLASMEQGDDLLTAGAKGGVSKDDMQEAYRVLEHLPEKHLQLLRSHLCLDGAFIDVFRQYMGALKTQDALSEDPLIKEKMLAGESKRLKVM